jgi:hypothetical protein
MRRLVASVFACLAAAGCHGAATAQNDQARYLVETNFGPLVLQVDLKRLVVAGVYPKGDGRVTGQLSDNGLAIRGIWTQPDGDHPCADEQNGSRAWGRFVFAFDQHPRQGTRMAGTWGYCDERPERPWNGVVD